MRSMNMEKIPAPLRLYNDATNNDMSMQRKKKDEKKKKKRRTK